VPQYTNLAQIVSSPANTAKAKAANAIKAAGSARVTSPQEAVAIKQAQTTETTTFNPTAIVDVNNDGRKDAAVGVITEETRFNENGVEQVPVTQIVEP
jgi:multidrug efflux system outer membrane protein